MILIGFLLKIIKIMFIQFGDKRINISLVKQYKPVEKFSYGIQNKSYIIEFIFLDGSQEELYFFEKENDRNKYLKILDQNFLDTNS